MRVRPASPPDPHAPAVDAAGAPALLEVGGARAILGASPDTPGLVAPVTPTAHTLFGPRGAALLAAGGPLVVADTGHHRVLGWRRAPEQDGVPADWVLGQASFDREARNGGGGVGAGTLQVPVGVCGYRGGLVVADAWNHRVLLWWEVPDRSGVPADLVLGQETFDAGLPNRGGDAPGRGTLHWPYGVAAVGDALVVADTGNRRVLVWHTPPERPGQPADVVLGQADGTGRSDNGGDAAGPGSFRWPHGLAAWEGDLAVSDAGNNRVLVFAGLPGRDAVPADRVLGQPDFRSVDHNGGRYHPTASTLNMPYGCAAVGRRLVVADTASSRLLAFDARTAGPAPAAVAVAGQPTFDVKGDNRWRAAARDSLCWPYGVAVEPDGAGVVVADSGNNRVLRWAFAADPAAGRAAAGAP